jgi:hypothetical protein
MALPCWTESWKKVLGSGSSTPVFKTNGSISQGKSIPKSWMKWPPGQYLRKMLEYRRNSSLRRSSCCSGVPSRKILATTLDASSSATAG